MPRLGRTEVDAMNHWKKLIKTYQLVRTEHLTDQARLYASETSREWSVYQTAQGGDLGSEPVIVRRVCPGILKSSLTRQILKK